ncbi:MAG: serine/threonine protein phosphatase, partial [Chloroflexi bacterium]
MDNDAPLFIIGDIHGHLEKMIRLLRFANLANSKAEWVGGAAQLWFMGD